MEVFIYFKADLCPWGVYHLRPLAVIYTLPCFKKGGKGWRREEWAGVVINFHLIFNCQVLFYEANTFAPEQSLISIWGNIV